MSDLSTIDPQFDPRDTAIIAIQVAAYDPEEDDDFFMSLVEDHEDITLTDSRLFLEFLENSIFESSGLWDAVVDICHHLALADAEDIGGECRQAFTLRAHLMAALKLYAKEKARREIENDYRCN